VLSERIISKMRMYALITDAGTAMAEAFLCEACRNPENEGYAMEQASQADDWNKESFVDVGDNNASDCCICGANVDDFK